MSVRSVIITPIRGVNDDIKGQIFEHLIEVCHAETQALPVVVLDVKTKWWGLDERVQRLFAEKKIDIVECLCVDTCQMWLEGCIS